MAYLTVNSQFNPFSFDEMLKPMTIYGQEYARQEEALDALSAQASPLETLSASPQDIAEYQTYQSFTDDLSNYANELATKGLSTTSRANITNMARRYNKEIAPINQAIAKREELDKEWRQKHGADTTWIGNRPSNLSLAEIKAGDYSRQYGVSGADIEKEAMTAAAAASARRYEEMAPKLALYNQYIQTGMAQGYNPELASAILSDLESSEFGTDISKIKESSNYDKMTPYEKQQFDAYLFRGFFNGIGYKQDIDYRKNLDLDRAIQQENLNRLREQSPTSSQQKTTGIKFMQIPQGFNPTENKELTQSISDLDKIASIQSGSGESIPLGGLIRTEDGVTTKAIQEQQNEVESLLKEINKLKASILEEPSDSTGQGTSQPTFNRLLSKADQKRANLQPKLNRLQNEYNRKQAKLQSDLNILKTYGDKYSDLADNLFDAITLGYQIDKNLTNQQINFYSPDIKKTEEDAVIKYLMTAGKIADKKGKKDTSGFLVLDKNNNISGNDSDIIDKIKKDEGIDANNYKTVITPYGIGVQELSGDKTYIPKGVTELDIAANIASVTSDWAGKYTNEDLQSMITLPNIDINALLSPVTNQNELNTRISKINELSPNLVENDLGNGFFGLNIKSSSDGNIYKVIYNSADGSFTLISDRNSMASMDEKVGNYQQAIYENIYGYLLP